MSLSFIRNDKNKFSNESTVYDVFDDNKLLTSIAIGYDKNIKKFYLTYWAYSSFFYKYKKEQDRSLLTWRKVILEFINLFENVFTKEDIVYNKFNEVTIDLTRDNVLYYISNLGLDEDNYEIYAVDDGEQYLNNLLDDDYLQPVYIENEDYEYIDYNIDTAADIYYDNDEINSIYAKINYELLE